jgi:hypothetical protein
MEMNGQLHAPGDLLQWEGARSIPLIGDLDMVAKGKIIAPIKSLNNFVLSLMS